MFIVMDDYGNKYIKDFKGLKEMLVNELSNYIESEGFII